MRLESSAHLVLFGNLNNGANLNVRRLLYDTSLAFYSNKRALHIFSAVNVTCFSCACRALFFKVRVGPVYPRPQTAIIKETHICRVPPTTALTDRLGIITSGETYSKRSSLKALKSATVGRRGYLLDIPSSDSKEDIKRHESPFFTHLLTAF